MRASAVVLSVLATVCAVAVPAASAAATTTSATRSIVVRPVTSSGHAAPGFQVSTETGGQVDCSSSSASPAAVSPDILECAPSAEYAVACWKSASPGHVLCLRNPRFAKLSKVRTHGFAHTGAAKDKSPLAITLGDGVHCSIRDGGAGPRLHGHPNWTVTYYCSHGYAVWSGIGAHHGGIHEAHALWQVHIAPSSGNGALKLRNVARAWFVGTRS